MDTLNQGRTGREWIRESNMLLGVRIVDQICQQNRPRVEAVVICGYMVDRAVHTLGRVAALCGINCVGEVGKIMTSFTHCGERRSPRQSRLRQSSDGRRTGTSVNRPTYKRWRGRSAALRNSKRGSVQSRTRLGVTARIRVW